MLQKVLSKMAYVGFNVFGPVYVDGVQLKISERLHAPEKVVLPPNFQMGNPTEVLFMEYDFSLEEKVVAWCDKQKEVVEERQKALEEAARAMEEAAKQAEEEAARLAAEKQAEAERLASEQLEAERLESERQALEQEERELELGYEGPNPEGDEAAYATKEETIRSIPANENEDQLSPERHHSNILSSSNSEHTNTPSNEEVQRNCATNGTANLSSQTPMQMTSQVPTKENSQLSTQVNSQVPTHEASQLPTKTASQILMPQKPSSQPVFYESVGGILTPLPAQPSARQISVASNASSAFDPKDFENNELDPFESVELKTIDDMAELNKVLQGVQVSQAQSRDSPQNYASAPGQVPNSQPMSSFVQTPVPANSVAGAMAYNAYNGTVQNGPAVSMHHSSQYHTTVSASPQHNRSLKDIGYPDINLGSSYRDNSQATVAFDTNSSSVSFQAQSQSMNYERTSNQWPNTNPQSYAQANVYSNYYNPAQVPQYHVNNTVATSMPGSLSNTSPANSAVNHFNSSSNTGMSQTFAGQNWQAQWQPRQQQHVAPSSGQRLWNDVLQKSSPDASRLSNHVTLANGVEYNKLKDDSSGSRSQSHSRSNTPIQAPGELRGSKSTPDLAAIESNEVVIQKSPVAPNVVRYQASPRNSSHNSILKNSSVKTEGSKPAATCNQQQRSSRPIQESPEMRRLVDRITDMGFLRTRVVTAVQKIGQDDKKVVDYLCSVNRLCEQGHSFEDSIYAFELLKRNEQKTQKYLKLCKIYKEYGFPNDKIKEGLLKNELDEEKTLDWLTSSSC